MPRRDVRHAGGSERLPRRLGIVGLAAGCSVISRHERRKQAPGGDAGPLEDIGDDGRFVDGAGDGPPHPRAVERRLGRVEGEIGERRALRPGGASSPSSALIAAMSAGFGDGITWQPPAFSFSKRTPLSGVISKISASSAGGFRQ